MRRRKTEILTLCAALAVTAITSGCQIKAREQEPPTITTSVPTSNEAETPSTEPTGEDGTKAVEEISAPKMKLDEYPAVDGSTATLPLSQALYQLVTGATAPEAETAIEHTKTTNAYNGLIYGYGADLVLAYEPAPSVYDDMKSAGVSLKIKPIGKDALVFMANEGNPVRSLTGQQIRDIYSGRIHNWTEVGGANKRIQAFQRPVGSGSQTLMDKLVMQGTAMDPDAPASSFIGDMGELIEKVASYNNQENALGYSVYFYARNMYTYGASHHTGSLDGLRDEQTMDKTPGLRFMAVDGVIPGNDTIKDGSYPYVNEFYAAIREDEPENSAAHILFDWLTTDDGQTLVESLGYVGLKDVDKKTLDMEDHSIVGDARITFTDQERFLLDADYAYGTEGVLVMDENMQVVETLNGVRLTSNMEMADLTRPVILEETNEGFAGLYDLQRHTWLLQPKYQSLSYREEEDCYYGYLTMDHGDRLVKVRVRGTRITEDEIPDYVTGSHIWEVNQEQQTARIIDEHKNEIKIVNFKEYLNYQYGYTLQDFFLANGANGEFELFDANGESVLNETSIENGRVFSIGTLSLDGSWMEGSWKDTGENFIYDLKQKQVVTGPEDKVSIYITDKDSNYIVENKDGITVYECGHIPVVSDDGHPYEFALGGGYYAYEAEDGLIVECKSPKKRYRLPVKNLDYGYHLSGNLFYFSADEKQGSGSGVYLGETFLMEGSRFSWWETGGYLVLDDGESRNLVVNRDEGTILIELNDGSQILRPFEKFMVVKRGNYFCVMDYQGRLALKQLAGDMTSD